MFYGCPKENSFPSFVDAPKGFFFFCLLQRKILFRRFSSFFRRLANVPNLNFCLGGIHKRRKRIFLGASIKHWNFLYRGDHTKFELYKCKCCFPIRYMKIKTICEMTFQNTYCKIIYCLPLYIKALEY